MDEHGQQGRGFSPRRSVRVSHEREIERLSARVNALERELAAAEAFAAVAAHELLEPLIMTEAYVALVNERLEEESHADVRRDLGAVARSAIRSRLLVETLLHDARSAGREVLRRPVDLNALVRDCVALLSMEIESLGAHVAIDDLPQVLGEESLVAGLYKNLLANALKYSPRNGSVIRVGASRNGSDPILFVESDGPAIPEADRRRIFEPFHRGNGERRARGTGLGLAICKEIVERHGGEIGVLPGDNGGNRFCFTLPAGSTRRAA